MTKYETLSKIASEEHQNNFKDLELTLSVKNYAEHSHTHGYKFKNVSSEDYNRKSTQPFHIH